MWSIIRAAFRQPRPKLRRPRWCSRCKVNPKSIFLSLVILCGLFMMPYVLFMTYDNSIHFKSVFRHVNEGVNILGKLNVATMMTDILRIVGMHDHEENIEKSGCFVPSFHQFAPTMMFFYHAKPAVKCDSKVWLTVRSGKLIMFNDTEQIHGDVQCQATPLTRRSDYTSIEGHSYFVTNGTYLEDEYISGHCVLQDAELVSFFHAQVFKKERVKQRRLQYDLKKKKGLAGVGLDVDVIFIGQDRMSGLSLMRHLPRTREFFVDGLGAVEMKGYTAVGESLPSNMLPLLTGKHQAYYEAKKEYNTFNGYSDNYPWIWKAFAEAGYVTSLIEDRPIASVFTSSYEGFKNPPVDHYYLPLAAYIAIRWDKFRNCIEGRPRVALENDYMKEVFRVYNSERQRKFVFTLRHEYSRVDNNDATSIDSHLRDNLKELNESSVLDNAIVIMFTTHSTHRYQYRGKLRYTQGKVEARMPYLAIRLPDKLKEAYPEMLDNLKSNAERLTTPFDVHQTLMEVLNFTGTETADISNRGVSLLKNIPISRDCTSAHIRPYWCSCMQWHTRQIDDSFTEVAKEHFLSRLNERTSSNRSICKYIKHARVISSSVLTANNNTETFYDVNDGNDHFKDQYEDYSRFASIIYKFIIRTDPGGGLYRVFAKRSYWPPGIFADYMSYFRINRRKRLSWCVDDNSSLKPFCICKKSKPQQ